MGLDLIPMGRAKPGHEEEWERLMRPLYQIEFVFQDGDESEQNRKRRQEISDEPFEVIGAPRVGHDAEANAWALERKSDDSNQSDEEFIQELEGYYVVELLLDKCDGVPKYSNGGISDELDATSFRGSFLDFCEGLIDDDLKNQAWRAVTPPAEAVEYGKALLKASEGDWIEPPPPPPLQPGLLGRMFGKKPEPAPHEPATEEDIEEAREILSCLGRWYIFWGERGHPIWAWW